MVEKAAQDYKQLGSVISVGSGFKPSIYEGLQILLALESLQAFESGS